MRIERRNRKRELNLYAFYDHTGLERHLEQMAERGWMLESFGNNFTLLYRRCEPRRLRFAVVYYPQSNQFDPEEPNKENLTFWDYCANVGWQIVTNSSDTHVFYNEDLDAVPIETEALVQVETMERAKKATVRTTAAFVLITLPMNLFVWVHSALRDPVAFLADGRDLAMMLLILTAILSFGGEVAGYLLWLRKAKRNARELGIFTPTRSSRWLCFLRSAWLWAFLLVNLVPLMLRSGSSAAVLRILCLMVGLCAVPAGVTVLLSRRLRAKRVPKRKAMLLVGAAASLSAVLMIGLITFGMFHGWFSSEPVNAEKYLYKDISGQSYRVDYVYHDRLPLYVQDLTETDYDRYSCEAHRRGNSIFARQIMYEQSTRWDDSFAGIDEPPVMDYTVTDVKASLFLAPCVQSIRDEYVKYGGEYRAVDSVPWGADSAWRACDERSEEWYNKWLLVYGNRIVEFVPYNFDLDASQMATVGEKLSK